MIPRILQFAFALVAGFALAPFAWSEEGAEEGPEVASIVPALTLAQSLLSTVDADQKIALRPLRGPESNVTERLARDLYEAMLDGLFRASNGNHAIMTRERLLQVYQTCEEFFSCGDMTARLAAARADVEVQCVVSPGPETVRLSCSAVQIETTVTVGRGSEDFPLTAFAHSQDWQQAIADIAFQLNRDIEAPGSMARIALIDQRTGANTLFASLLANKLRFELGRRMTQRQNDSINEARARVQLGYEEEALPEFPRYSLHGMLWQTGEERVNLTVEARHNGRTLAMSSADIAAAAIPERLQIEILGTDVEVEASAEAVVSSRLDAQAARRAAMNLARARVIAQALGTEAPAIGTIVTETDAALALGDALQFGIPYDETVEDITDEEATNRIALRLTARVRPVATAEEPILTAELDRPVYRTGEAIGITLNGAQGTHIGLFAWGADNRVVRVYPTEEIPVLRLTGAGPAVLPREGEDRAFQSAPMPMEDVENLEDHEMFLVIASRVPLDWEVLAPEMGGSVEETMARAKDGSGFLQALAAMDLSRATVLTLPYQIRE